jgi:hypothetical protein
MKITISETFQFQGDYQSPPGTRHPRGISPIKVHTRVHRDSHTLKCVKFLWKAALIFIMQAFLIQCQLTLLLSWPASELNAVKPAKDLSFTAC